MSNQNKKPTYSWQRDTTLVKENVDILPKISPKIIAITKEVVNYAKYEHGVVITNINITVDPDGSINISIETE